jgi:hypothetical protein
MGAVLVSDSRENFERMVSLAKGPKGDRGERGERGERGLAWVQGWAVVFLFALAALSGAGNLLWTAHEVNAAAAAQRQEQAAQQQAAGVVQEKLCTTLRKLSALEPPPGNTLTNPSRGFDQDLHATLNELGPDLGCRGR